jgi:hypothetical protein
MKYEVVHEPDFRPMGVRMIRFIHDVRIPRCLADLHEFFTFSIQKASYPFD